MLERIFIGPILKMKNRYRWAIKFSMKKSMKMKRIMKRLQKQNVKEVLPVMRLNQQRFKINQGLTLQVKFLSIPRQWPNLILRIYQVLHPVLQNRDRKIHFLKREWAANQQRLTVHSSKRDLERIIILIINKILIELKIRYNQLPSKIHYNPRMEFKGVQIREGL